ncbi:unnamed protein product, partial [Phaeothamnion confervicola]
MVGYVSDMIADRTHGLGAVALCNGYGSPDELADFAIRAIAAARAGEPLPDLPPTDPDPFRIEGAAAYAGSYRDPVGGRRVTFVAEGDGLVLETEFGRAAAAEATASGPAPDGDGSAPDAPDTPVVEVFHGGDWFIGEAYEGP